MKQVLTVLTIALTCACPKTLAKAPQAPPDTGNTSQPVITLFGGIKQNDQARTLLFGNLQVNKVRGQTIWLQSETPKMDTSVFAGVIELVQRQIPQSPRGPLFGTVLMQELMQKARNPLRLSLLQSDPIELKAQTARLDRECMNLAKQAAIDLDEAKQKFEQEKPILDERAIHAAERLENMKPDLESRLERSRRKIEDMKSHCQGKLNQMRRDTEISSEDLSADAQNFAVKTQTTIARLQDKMPDSQTDAQPLATELQTSAKLKEIKSGQPTIEELSNDLAVLARSQDLRGKILPEAQEAELLQEDAGERSLSWDKWYATIAKTIKEPLLSSVKRHGDPAGSNTLRITVWADHRIEVALDRTGNADFDLAVVEAYKSLNFHPALQFPQGSRRKSVTYLSDHTHKSAGTAIEVEAKKLIHGDLER